MLPEVDEALAKLNLATGYYSFEYWLDGVYPDKTRYYVKPAFHIVVLEPLTRVNAIIPYEPYELDEEIITFIEKWGYKEANGSKLVIAGKADKALLNETKFGKTILFINPLNHDLQGELPDSIEFNADFYMLGHYHYLRKGIMTEGLPETGIMGGIYAEVLPQIKLKFDRNILTGAKELCGIISNNFKVKNESNLTPEEIAKGAPMGYDIVVFKDEAEIDVNAGILSIPYNDGRVIYNMLKLTKNINKAPIAERMLYNLLKYSWSST